MFCHIKLKVRELLPQMLASAMPFFTALTKDVLVCKVVDDKDVQFHWSIFSVDIEEDNDPNKLLKYMIDLWVNIRANAFTSSWMYQILFLSIHESLSLLTTLLSFFNVAIPINLP